MEFAIPIKPFRKNKYVPEYRIKANNVLVINKNSEDNENKY